LVQSQVYFRTIRLKERLIMDKILIQNEAKCKKCGDIIFSAHRHDFKYCSCGAIAVDGGMDYARRVGDAADIEERSIYMDKSVLSKCIEGAKWARETGRNDLGTALAVIRALRDGGILK
jgi:hypothetical protein